MSTKCITGAVVVMLLAHSALAQWKPPPDGKFTEGQLKTFLDTQKDWLAENAKIVQSISGSQTDAEKLAAMGDLDQRYQACLERHHMTREEYEWIARQALAAWTSLTYFDHTFKNSQEQLASQARENDANLADAQSRLATYQKAQEDGVRVMTPADRDEAINSAKEDRQSALDEAKERGDDLTAALSEAKQQAAAAKSADDLAQNPPSDISADDRPAYIENKKTEAQSARDAAKEARTRADDAAKEVTEAQARAAVAARKAAHPEIPLTDDDKASVKSENDAAIASAKNDIAECRHQADQIAAASQQLKISSEQMTKDMPQENVDIMRKYADRYHDQLADAFTGNAATQPAP
jgi:hypothetical protein